MAPELLRVRRADVLGNPSLDSLLASSGVPPLRPGERLLVVGNPPYVEAKRLPRETTARLKACYPGAVTGAPDLYLYFLHVCLGWLRVDDSLAFVLPNKLLVNANAQRLRERLLDEGRLRGLWFATQAAIFPDAAVYPVVLFAGGARPKDEARVEVARINRSAAGGVARGRTIPVEPNRYRKRGRGRSFRRRRPPRCKLPWRFSSGRRRVTACVTRSISAGPSPSTAPACGSDTSPGSALMTLMPGPSWAVDPSPETAR